MKFELDAKYFMSHMVLKSRDLTENIVKTEQWKNDEEMEAKLFVNGVEVNSDHIEKFLRELWDQANIDTGADAFREEVKKEARKLLEEKAKNVTSVMEDLTQKLYEVDNLLPYNWEDCSRLAI